MPTPTQNQLLNTYLRKFLRAYARPTTIKALYEDISDATNGENHPQQAVLREVYLSLTGTELS